MIRICVCEHECQSRNRETILGMIAGSDEEKKAVLAKIPILYDDKGLAKYSSGSGLALLSSDEYFRVHRIVRLKRVLYVDPEDHGLIGMDKLGEMVEIAVKTTLEAIQPV